MKKDIAENWALELESGKWKQANGALNNDDKRHCCLGVLCEMAIEAGVRIKKREATASQKYRAGISGRTYTYANRIDVPPASVWRWAGMSGENPYVNGSPIAELNDDGTSFKQLAKLIRQHADEL